MLNQPLNEYALKRQRKEILERLGRVAVVGIRTEPIFKSYGLTEKLIQYGVTVLPIIANCPSFLGVACYGRLEEVPGDIDLLQIYSQPGLNLLGIAQEAIQKGVKTFWIEDDEASDAVRKLLTDSKIYVVEHESLESEFRKHRLTAGADSPEVAPPTSIRVSDRMTRQPVTIMANDSMQDALNKMRKGHFRHLPVVGHGDRLIGMLSDRDLRLVQPPSAFLSYDKIQEQLAAITVAQAAAFSPVAVAYDAPLDEAVELMLRWQVGALPVVAGDFHLVGIITYSDILKEFLARARHSNLVVRKTDGLLGSDD